MTDPNWKRSHGTIDLLVRFTQSATKSPRPYMDPHVASYPVLKDLTTCTVVGGLAKTNLNANWPANTTLSSPGTIQGYCHPMPRHGSEQRTSPQIQVKPISSKDSKHTEKLSKLSDGIRTRNQTRKPTPTDLHQGLKHTKWSMVQTRTNGVVWINHQFETTRIPTIEKDIPHSRRTPKSKTCFGK